MSAAESVKAFGDRSLGGQLGVVAVLHTWGQDLGEHIHLHCIVTGGALSADGPRWRSAAAGFLLPVVPLAQAFRDQLCQGLVRAYRQGVLVLAGACGELAQPAHCARVWAEVQAKAWEVYAKPAFGGAKPVLDYLGRYVHRVAIGNHRIVGIADGAVQFRWRD